MEREAVVARDAPVGRPLEGAPGLRLTARDGTMRPSLLARSALAVALSAGVAQAQLAGTLNFSGSLSLRSAAPPGSPFDPSNVLFDFSPAGGGIGGIRVSDDGNTGSFAIFNVVFPAPQVTGTIRDVTPSAGPYVVPAFLQVPIAPLYSFDLRTVAPGSFSSANCFVAPAAGQTCTPTDGVGNPTVLSLTNTLNGPLLNTSLTFAVTGIVTGPGGPASFTGIFSTQYAEMSYQQVLTSMASPTGTPRNSFSATFIVGGSGTTGTVPEPATVALLGGGLLALGGFSLRRRRSAD